MNYNNIDSSMSSEERDPLTRDYDFLEAATQYINTTTDGFFQNVPSSISADQEQSSSVSSYSYPPASAFQSSPARSHYSQHYMARRNDDTTTSASGVSWNSVNANSQMSTWTPSFISHYMIPWQQEEKKPSSWDDDSDDGDASDRFRDERMSEEGSDAVSVASKASTRRSLRKSRGLCDILCMEIEIPIRAAYAIVMLVFSLVGLCFMIGYQAEREAAARGTSITSMASVVLTPVAPPTPTLAPSAATAMPSPSPSVPATSQPTQCTDSKLSVDKLCYVAGDDGILVEFDVCQSQDSDWIGIYPVSAEMLADDYVEWSWSCGTKLCRASPKTNDFLISTERLMHDGLYRAYYMRYNDDGTPFASVAMSEIFQISDRCI